MKMYMTLMSAYGTSSGIDFKFGGTVANTTDACNGCRRPKGRRPR